MKSLNSVKCIINSCKDQVCRITYTQDTMRTIRNIRSIYIQKFYLIIVSFHVKTENTKSGAYSASKHLLGVIYV